MIRPFGFSMAHGAYRAGCISIGPFCLERGGTGFGSIMEMRDSRLVIGIYNTGEGIISRILRPTGLCPGLSANMRWDHFTGRGCGRSARFVSARVAVAIAASLPILSMEHCMAIVRVRLWMFFLRGSQIVWISVDY